MGGLFNRLKIWVFEEVLKSKDLNAEFDNIINHMAPIFISSFSQTLLQMQTQLDPGDLGTENPAQSLAEEIQELRFVIARIIGLPLWYQLPALSIEDINTLLQLNNSIPKNRIVSGITRGATNAQPIFLRPDGTVATVTLMASAVDFLVRIDGVAYSFTADTALSGLSLAPSSNNTALVNDTNLTNQYESQFAGESDSNATTLFIDTAGTNITNKIGTEQVFQIDSGGNTEYFTAYIQSATELVKARRGYFFDSTDTPIQRITIADNDVITLMKVHYIFAKTDMTIMLTDNPPVYATDQPTGPAANDYWFDLNNQTWKVFTGVMFISADAHLIGMAFTDTTGVKGARSFEYFAGYNVLNTIELERKNTNEIQAKSKDVEVSVAGNTFVWGENIPIWNMPTDLTDTDGSTVEAASTFYYIYITERGDTVFSTIKPYARETDLLGKYHPYSPWRAVGVAYNDSGSDFTTNTSLITNGSIFERSVKQNHLQHREWISGGVLRDGGIFRSASSGAASTAGGPILIFTLDVVPSRSFRPIHIGLYPDGSGSDSYLLGSSSGPGVQFVGRVLLYRNPDGAGDTEMARFNIAGVQLVEFPVSSIQYIDSEYFTGSTYPETIRYTLYIQHVSGGGVTDLNFAVMKAYEE